MKKDDLVRAFSDACLEFACFLDDYVRENCDRDAETYLFPIISTQMDDIDYTWWSDYGELEAYNTQITTLSNTGRFEGEYQKGLSNIMASKRHLDDYELIVKNSKSPLEHLKYVPHVIGLTDEHYGADLRKTEGYQALEAVSETIDKTNFQIILLNDPSKPKLKSSFCLAVIFYTEDTEPFAAKVTRASEAGLFDAMKSHYNFD